MPFIRSWIAVGVWLVATAIAAAAPMKALIVDGQNAHNWKETTPMLKQLLEQTDLFSVDVATSPPKGGDMSRFQPNFAAYELVVLNYQGDDWPEETQKAFVDYVKNGGGVVCYHFAAAAFPQWREYNRIIGVGGWGNRDETAGPYLCWRDGKIVRATDPPGKAGFHGPAQTFRVDVRDLDHPITRGLPKAFMHTADELYCRLRGPAENVTVLATAFAPKAKGGTDENEPMLMTITYGKGRVFSTLLGHAGEQLKSVAFIATFQRGAEWAATGKVTQPVPADFPTADKASVREIAARPKDAARQWVVYPGGDGPGKGKHVVLVSGDEEYRSEQMLPQLAKILARRHGFDCTVLFAVDPATGKIDPTCQTNIPGLAALDAADLMIIFTRFRDLPDEQMRHIVRYVESGKPIIGIRTATHAFQIPAEKTYSQYSFDSKVKDWEGGFGRHILGETWISHHGAHGRESTRGVIDPQAKDNPIVRGCEDILGSDRRLHRAAAVARWLPAAGAGRSSLGHDAYRPAGRRAEERSHATHRLDQNLSRRRRPGRPRLCDDDGLRQGFPQRGLSAPVGQRRLLVRRIGGQDPGPCGGRPRRPLRAVAVRFFRQEERHRQAFGCRVSVAANVEH